MSRKRSHPLYRKCLTWGTILGKPKKPPSLGKQAAPTHYPCRGEDAKSAQKPEGQPLEEGKPTFPLLCLFSGAWGVEAWPSLLSLLLVPGLFFIPLCHVGTVPMRPLGDRQVLT